MKQRRKLGFGLLEAVIASGILVMVAGAALGLNTTVLKGSTQLTQRTSALFLAVEGLEMVRQIRDSNYVDTNPNTRWDNGLSNGDPLRLNQVGNLWNLSSGTETITLGPHDTYNRSISITTLAQGQKQVQVTVGWAGQQIKLSTILADAKPSL